MQGQKAKFSLVSVVYIVFLVVCMFGISLFVYLFIDLSEVKMVRFDYRVMVGLIKLKIGIQVL